MDWNRKREWQLDLPQAWLPPVGWQWGWLHSQLGKSAFRQPGWERVRYLASYVRCTLHKRESRVWVGTDQSQAILTGKEGHITDAHIERLRCNRCKGKQCPHRMAFALAMRVFQGLPSESTRVPGEPSLVSASPFKRTGPRQESTHLRLELGKTDGQFLEGSLKITTIDLKGNRGSNRPSLSQLLQLEGKVTPQEWRVIRRLEQHRLLKHMKLHKYAHSIQLVKEVSALEDEIIQELVRLQPLYYHKNTVSPQGDQWRGRLQSFQGSDGGFLVSWADKPTALLPIGQGYVIDSECLLKAVDPSHRWQFDLMTERQGLYGRSHTSRELAAHIRPGIQLTPFRTTKTQPQSLVLSGPSTGFQYGEKILSWHDSVVLNVAYGADGNPEEVWLRDLASERALEASTFNGFIHTNENHRQVSTGSPRVALDDLPTLEPKLDVQEKDGYIAASASFHASGLEVPPSRIMAAWQREQEVITLSDGSFARLPQEWLKEHACQLTDILLLNTLHGPQLPITTKPALSPQTDSMRHDSATSLEQVKAHLSPGLADLKGEPRDYQYHGIAWMLSLAQREAGGVLADDMGLGKTLQSLAYLLARKHGAKTPMQSLVVVPTSVLENWAVEAARFTPSLKVYRYYGKSRKLPAQADLILTTYALLRRDIRQLKQVEWDTVLLDEGQNIKTPSSKTARASRRLQARARFVLTGTPFENALTELWSVYQFVLPGLLSTQRRFQREFGGIEHRPKAAASQMKLAHLGRLTKPYLLRRLKADVTAELPPKTIEYLYCEMPPEHRAAYQRIEKNYRRSVGYRIAKVGFSRTKFMILEALMRMRQAACDPTLIPQIENVPSGKRTQLLELIKTGMSSGRRFLVFSQWTTLLGNIRGDLETVGIEYLYLDGKTKGRHELQSRWNKASGPPVFLISLKAGGTGLNLTGANTVVHMDPWWNPAVEDQAMDRAYRIGQDKPVHVYKLLAKDTVEARVLRVQSRKRLLFESVLGEQGATPLDSKYLDVLFGDAVDDGSGPMVLTSETTDESRAAPESQPQAPASDTHTEALQGLPKMVADLLLFHGQLTNHTVRTAMVCSADVARRRLKKWVKAGLLVRRGRRKNTRYLPG